MKKKEYISPESTVVLLDSSVLATDTIPSGSDDNFQADVKGTSDWQEPEYDDDGFGW